MTEKKIVRKVLKTGKAMGKFMADYYYDLDKMVKTGEKKIAWCTSVGPALIIGKKSKLSRFEKRKLRGFSRILNKRLSLWKAAFVLLMF